MVPRQEDVGLVVQQEVLFHRHRNIQRDAVPVVHQGELRATALDQGDALARLDLDDGDVQVWRGRTEPGEKWRDDAARSG